MNIFKDPESLDFDTIFNQAVDIDGGADSGLLKEAKSAYCEIVTFLSGLHPDGTIVVCEDGYHRVDPQNGILYSGLITDASTEANTEETYELMIAYVECKVCGGGPDYYIVKTLEEANALER